MVTSLRALWRLLRVVLHALHGLVWVVIAWPLCSATRRSELIQWWSHKMLTLLGVTLTSQGQPRQGAALIVINHVSWLDIMLIHAVCPQARFVSKAQVQGWPLIGRLVSAGGTLYLKRERARDALRVVHLMAQALQEGHQVAVFPEGTTGPGWPLLPFHANLLQAAIATEVPIQPVALKFSDPDHEFSPAVHYLGETTLAHSLWSIACAQGLRAHVVWLPAIASAHADRRAMAAAVQSQIAQALQSPG